MRQTELLTVTDGLLVPPSAASSLGDIVQALDMEFYENVSGEKVMRGCTGSQRRAWLQRLP